MSSKNFLGALPPDPLLLARSLISTACIKVPNEYEQPIYVQSVQKNLVGPKHADTPPNKILMCAPEQSADVGKDRKIFPKTSARELMIFLPCAPPRRFLQPDKRNKMAKSVELSLALVFFISLFIKAHSLSFTLSAGSKKCLREEVHKDVLVTGEYRLSEAPIKTHLTVRFRPISIFGWPSHQLAYYVYCRCP